jgi:hypothetical protein
VAHCVCHVIAPMLMPKNCFVECSAAAAAAAAVADVAAAVVVVAEIRAQITGLALPARPH